jgi:hypothetical protein
MEPLEKLKEWLEGEIKWLEDNPSHLAAEYNLGRKDQCRFTLSYIKKLSEA